MTSRELVVFHGLLAGVQLAIGATGWIGLLAAHPASWIILTVATLQMVVAVYTNRIITTSADRARSRGTRYSVAPRR